MNWKIPVFVICLFSLIQSGHAQMLKNTLMTGGSVGFQFTTDHENHVSDATFSFAPVLGGFVSKNFVLGIAPYLMYTRSSGGYSYIDSSSHPPQQVNVHIYSSQTSLGLGPFARYYIKVGPKVYVYIHGSPSIMATWNTYSSDAGSPTSRTVSATWVIGPGMSVMLTRSVALELSIYYQGIYHRSSQYQNGNLLGSPGSPYVDNGVVFNVGFQVYLERNKKGVPKEKIN
jgi:hypothetical protein